MELITPEPQLFWILIILETCFLNLNFDGNNTPGDIGEIGKIQIPLIDFAITSINGSGWGLGNDIDHYNGAWSNEFQEGITAQNEVILLTWIEKSFEMMGVLFHDSSGQPIWTLSTSDNLTDSDDGWYPANPIDNYDVVTSGFNPIGYSPPAYNVEQYVQEAGTGKRKLKYKDPLIFDSLYNQLKFDFSLNISANNAQIDFNGREAILDIDN